MASVNPRNNAARDRTTPRWLLATSVVVLVVTIGFLMGLVLLAVFGHEVPEKSRFLVTFILALCAGFGAAGLGGYASLEGKIPFLADKNPFVVSAGGGIAVMLIVLLLTPRLLPGSEGEELDLRLSSVRGTAVSDQPARVQIDAAFGALSLTGGKRLVLALGNTAACSPSTYRATVDSPALRSMVVLLRRDKSQVSCAQLVVERPDGTVERQGPVSTIDWGGE